LPALSYMTTRTLFRAAFAASVLFISACGGKKTPTQPGNTASIGVSSAAATLSVVQSANGTVAITVSRTNYTGDVALTADGLPSGVTATFTPAALTGSVTSSSLQLTASGSAAVGAATVTVRARGTGVADATTNVALTVTAATGGSVALATTPPTASIVAGQTTSSVVAITRTGAANEVNMTVTGAPVGMTTSFSTANPVTAPTVTLAVSTTTAVVPGAYTLTARANGSGLTEAVATFVVTVSAPPSNSITWRFCDTQRTPIWFAVQDGLTGSWNRITETTPGVYTFGYGQPQVGVATVSVENSVTVTRVRYFGLSEVSAAAAAECTANPAAGTKTITGSVSGLVGATESGTISLGTALSSPTSVGTPNFTLNRVQNGPLDLVAVRGDVSTSSVIRVLIQRLVNLADGGTTGVLDLSGGTSIAPTTGSFTITAPNDGALVGTNRFLTASAAAAGFTISSLSTGAAASYQGVPETSMNASDVQRIDVTQNAGTTLTRFISRFTRGPATVSVSMPSDPGSPTVSSVGTTPYPRASATGSLPGAFNTDVAVIFVQSARSRRWEMSATAGGRTVITNYTFTMPDFSALTGWQNTWALGSGTADVTSNFSGQSGPAAPALGAITYTTGRLGTFTF
jgi:hypothetical protein